MTKIFVVDDHAVVCEGLTAALSRHAGMQVLGTAAAPDMALAQIATLRPDVIILDLVFGGTVRLDIVRNCREARPEARILVFSSLDPRVIEHNCVQAGADAVVHKEQEMADLVAAVMQPPSGSNARHEGIAADVPPQPLPPCDLAKVLTVREREIAALLGQGATIAQISTALGISKKTTAVHSDNMRRKLGCANSRQLVTLLAKLASAGVA